MVESGEDLVWSFEEPEDGTKIYAIATTQMTPWDFHLLQVTILDTKLFNYQSEAITNISENFSRYRQDNLEIIFPRGEFAD